MPRVEIAKAAPNFMLPDMNGKNFDLYQEASHGPILLVFNRGFV